MGFFLYACYLSHFLMSFLHFSRFECFCHNRISGFTFSWRFYHGIGIHHSFGRSRFYLCFFQYLATKQITLWGINGSRTTFFKLSNMSSHIIGISWEHLASLSHYWFNRGFCLYFIHCFGNILPTTINLISVGQSIRFATTEGVDHALSTQCTKASHNTQLTGIRYLCRSIGSTSSIQNLTVAFWYCIHGVHHSRDRSHSSVVCWVILVFCITH